MDIKGKKIEHSIPRLRNIAKEMKNGGSDPPSSDPLKSSNSSSFSEVRIKPITVVADDRNPKILEVVNSNCDSESSSHLSNEHTKAVGGSRTPKSSVEPSTSDSTPHPQPVKGSSENSFSNNDNPLKSLQKGDNPQSTNRNRGSGGKRIPRAEMLLRIRIVESLMLRGFMGRDVQRGLDHQFKTTIPWYTVQKYIRHVAAMWEEEDALQRPYRRQRQLRQLHDVADTLLEKKSYKEWLETQRLIARIEGNEAPLQHELSVQSKFDGWSVEELEAYAQTAGKTIPVRFLTHKESSPCGQLPGESQEDSDESYH